VSKENKTGYAIYCLMKDTSVYNIFTFNFKINAIFTFKCNFKSLSLCKPAGTRRDIF